MSGRPPGHIVLGILRVLEECGPMTRREIATALGISSSLVSPVVSRMLRDNSKAKRRLHIDSYRREEEGSTSHHARAVIALGGRKKDAPKPEPLPKSERMRRYHQASVAKVSSVWEFAMPRAARRAAAKARREGAAAQ